MTTHLRSARFGTIGLKWGARPGPSTGTLSLGRLIQMILALYLLPVLLIVLVVGGIGMLVLAVARALASAIAGSENGPRTPAGPGPF